MYTRSATKYGRRLPSSGGTEPSVYIDIFRRRYWKHFVSVQKSFMYKKYIVKGGLLEMVTIEILFSFSIVLATFTGGAYALGYTIGKLSSKRK